MLVIDPNNEAQRTLGSDPSLQRLVVYFENYAILVPLEGVAVPLGDINIQGVAIFRDHPAKKGAYFAPHPGPDEQGNPQSCKSQNRRWELWSAKSLR